MLYTLNAIMSLNQLLYYYALYGTLIINVLVYTEPSHNWHKHHWRQNAKTHQSKATVNKGTGRAQRNMVHIIQ